MNWNLGAGLESRGVIVTGAAGGIGRAVAEAFAGVGARVLATDLHQAAVDEVVASLPGAGHAGIASDLADMHTHATLVERARTELGSLYALAHVAAVIARQSSLDDVTEQDWDLQNQVNLKASFFLCRAAAAAMREQGQGGRLITFASQGWWTGGFGGSVVYSATKGGVVSMTRGLARTYGPHGITANCIAPGAVRTSMGTEGVSSELREAITTATPLGRWAEPREIAGAVVFLASNHASYITGATLNISGGWLMY